MALTSIAPLAAAIAAPCFTRSPRERGSHLAGGCDVQGAPPLDAKANDGHDETPHTGRSTMKAIAVTDQAAGSDGMKLVERPEPKAAINDVIVQVHASGFVPTELAWPSTWTDRRDRDRTPSIPGHELAGVVTALGYGTKGLSVGQRVFGLADWYRDGTLTEYVAIEARNLAPLPG